MALTYNYKGKYATGIGIAVGGFDFTNGTSTNGVIYLPVKRVLSCIIVGGDRSTGATTSPIYTNVANSGRINVSNLATGCKFSLMFVGIGT